MHLATISIDGSEVCVAIRSDGSMLDIAAAARSRASNGTDVLRDASMLGIIEGGAAALGMRTVWLSGFLPWAEGTATPDYTILSLGDLLSVAAPRYNS